MTFRAVLLTVFAGAAAGCDLFPPSEELPTPVADAGTVEVVPPKLPDPFHLVPFSKSRITSIGGEPNFQKIEAEIDWGDFPKRNVTLSVQLESPCFPFEKWQQNPPPQGHNWPEECDAYDRNFSLILDPPQKDGDPPGFELVRSITPFGGPQAFDLDLTDLANARPGKHRLRAAISTWPDGSGRVSGAKGGWDVTAILSVDPGAAPRNVLAAIPVFDGSHSVEGNGPELSFTLPEGTVSAFIEYRATGHGGGTADSACIGHADEFCFRHHQVFVDGAKLLDFNPWREDCADFCTLQTGGHPFGPGLQWCLENPCGAIQSVRAPRANWCPGAITAPEFIFPGEWSVPGPHTFQWNIDKIAPDGGSWRLSAIVYAYGG